MTGAGKRGHVSESGDLSAGLAFELKLKMAWEPTKPQIVSVSFVRVGVHVCTRVGGCVYTHVCVVLTKVRK